MEKEEMKNPNVRCIESKRERKGFLSVKEMGKEKKDPRRQ